MRSLYLKLAAAMLVAAAAMLVIYQTSARPDPVADEVVVPQRGRKAVRSGGQQAQASAFLTDYPMSHGAAKPTTHRAAEADHGSVANDSADLPDAAVLAPGRAIQLGVDVQLPAALMVWDEPEMADSNEEISPAVVEANQNIGDTFYQEIAAMVASQPVGSITPGVNNPQNTGADDTTVIPPGPEVDRARARADQQYQALFGDDAYNRQTMNSAIDVTLPAAPGSSKL